MDQPRIRVKQIETQAEGYLELGMAGQALEALSRLGHSDEFPPRALYLRGEALRSLERYEEALEPLGRAARVNPEDVQVWLALGWCHKRTSRLDLAIADIERALDIDPTAPLLHYNLACYLSLAGKKKRAIVHLSQAFAIDGHYRTLVPQETDFDPIRADPEFKALTTGPQQRRPESGKAGMA